MSIVKTVLARAVLATALLLATTTAVAQTGVQPPPGLRDAFRPDFLRRDVPLFIEQLGLVNEQVPIMEAFFQDYEDEFSDGVDRIRASMSRLRPAPPAPGTDVAVRRQAIHDQIDALRAELRKAAGEERDPEKIRALTENYQTRMEGFYKELRELSPNVSNREEIDTMMREMGQVLVAWEVERAAMSDELLVNVQSILLDSQRERWPAFDRFLRRQKTLVRGKLSGESLNIFAILRELDLRQDETPELATTLEAYDLGLDEALRARNRHLREFGTQLAEAMRVRDGAKAMPLLQREIVLRTAVRDVNERSLDAIADALPPADAARLIETANTRAFARVYRPTRTRRLFQAAMRLDDLSEASLVAITELEAFYTEDLARRNEDLRQTILANEPASMRHQYEGALDPEATSPGQADATIRSAFDDRASFETGVEAQVRGLLTPEQIERLPATRRASRAVGADATSIMTRFDVDGDGKLDAGEREAVRAYFQSQGSE